MYPRSWICTQPTYKNMAWWRNVSQKCSCQRNAIVSVKLSTNTSEGIYQFNSSPSMYILTMLIQNCQTSLMKKQNSWALADLTVFMALWNACLQHNRTVIDVLVLKINNIYVCRLENFWMKIQIYFLFFQYTVRRIKCGSHAWTSAQRPCRERLCREKWTLCVLLDDRNLFS